MIRTASVTLAIVCGAGIAHADPIKLDDPKPSPPDPLTEEQSEEANLESIAKRSGTMFLVAGGGGLVYSGEIGRGPTVSFRLDHVMTPHTLLTIEITGNTLLHEATTAPGMKTVLHDDDGNLLVGAQYYTNDSLWIRGAGGLALHSTETASVTKPHPHAGIGGLVGAGFDFVRARHIVLDLELFFTSSVDTTGLLVSSGLCVGIAFY